jgi:hypothetical protein
MLIGKCFIGKGREKGTGYFSVERVSAHMLEALRAENSQRDNRLNTLITLLTVETDTAEANRSRSSNRSMPGGGSKFNVQEFKDR